MIIVHYHRVVHVGFRRIACRAPSLQKDGVEILQNTYLAAELILMLKVSPKLPSDPSKKAPQSRR